MFIHLNKSFIRFEQYAQHLAFMFDEYVRILVAALRKASHKSSTLSFLLCKGITDNLAQTL